MILEQLVPSLDFKPDTESVENQRGLGSCVAQAGATALEIAYKRAGVPTNFSQMFLYYYIQKDAGTLGTAGGGYPGSLAPILSAHGCCTEADWPYDESLLGQEPSTDARARAKQVVNTPVTMYGIGAMPESVLMIKRHLNMGRPVIIGINPGGILTIKSGTPWREHTWDTTLRSDSGHAVTIIGYDDAAQRFLVENSWGPKWADGGFYGMPYEYFALNGDNVQVVSAFSFNKLPVPDVPVDGYVPYGPATFDSRTNIIEVPQLAWFQSAFGGPRYHKNVTAKVLDAGAISKDSERFRKWGMNYVEFAPFMDDNRYIGFPELVVDGVPHQNVMLTNPKIELINGQSE